MSLKSVSAYEDVIGDLPSPKYFADGIGETNEEGVEKSYAKKASKNNSVLPPGEKISMAERDAFSGLTKTKNYVSNSFMQVIQCVFL